MTGESALRGKLPLLIPALLLVAGLVRLWGIEDRPMHHDEALNSVFLEQLWQQGEFEYSPLRFHGPSLAYLTLPFVWASPAERYRETRELTYRILPALLGIALVLLTFTLAPGIGQGAALAAVGLCALSPTMVFYSRYYIHEMPLVVFSFLAITSAWQLLRSLESRRPAWGWAVLFGASLGLMHATKETFVIAVAAAGVGLAASIGTIRPPAGLLRPLLVAAGTATFVSVLFFSAFFSHAQGPIDSLLAFTPYLQQGTDSGSGFAHPFGWYFEVLTHYERGDLWFSSEALIVPLAAVGVIAAARRWGLDPEHVSLARFFAGYTVASVAIYSAIPYKTPWCVLTPLHGMIVLAGIGLVSLWRSTKSVAGRRLLGLVVLAGFAHLGFQTYLLNFRHADDERNPHVYAHTHPDLRSAAALVARIARFPDVDKRPSVHVFNWGGNASLYFYLRGVDRVRFRSAEETREASEAMSMFLIHEARRDDLPDQLEAGYHIERFQLRSDRWGLLYVRQGLWDASGEQPAS